WGPTPESKRRRGVWIAPAHRITSRDAPTEHSLPSSRNSTPVQRVPVSVSLTAGASVRTVRFLLPRQERCSDRSVPPLGKTADLNAYLPCRGNIAHHRPEVSVRRATASAPLDVQDHRADALGLGDVQVVEVRHPAGPAGVDERGRHRVEVTGALDADRAAGAAERAGAALPVLRLLEQGQHGDEVPERVAGLRPTVV